MLRYLSQDMRYMLLQKKDRMDNTALHVAAPNGHQLILAAILKAVSEHQWFILLHMTEFRRMNVVQFSAYWGKRSTIETIKDHTLEDFWLDLVSTPLPCFPRYDLAEEIAYQRAIHWIDEYRTAAKIQKVLKTTDKASE